MDWTPQADAQIILLRCDRIHPYDIGVYTGYPAYEIKKRLNYLKKVLNYEYPKLIDTSARRVWSNKTILRWRACAKLGKSQRTRSRIMRELARIYGTSYDVVYQRCSPNWPLNKMEAIAEPHTMGERNE